MKPHDEDADWHFHILVVPIPGMLATPPLGRLSANVDCASRVPRVARAATTLAVTRALVDPTRQPESAVLVAQ